MAFSRRSELKTALCVLALCAGAHAVAQTVTLSGPYEVPACKYPEWPKDALRNGQSGTVTLGVELDADGTVLDTEVRKSSGFALLDDAARSGLAGCKMGPGIVNGVPARSWTQMQIIWSLDKPDPAQELVRLEALNYRAKALVGDRESLLSFARVYAAHTPNEAALEAAMREALVQGVPAGCRATMPRRRVGIARQPTAATPGARPIWAA